MKLGNSMIIIFLFINAMFFQYTTSERYFEMHGKANGKTIVPLFLCRGLWPE